ncbi:MAG: ABC transporter permease [Butyrivibrio sp.]|nr:ABC transporter permease [Butyrivibrio sp.]
MRLDGDGMVVGIKDAARLFGICITACCAVLVCTLFLNYKADLAYAADKITAEAAMSMYNAQVSTVRMVCSLCGGCLLATSAVMLVFYIKHYIDVHKKELGILKALGCSAMKIALNFCSFGISVFIGGAAGFSGAFLLMPLFYKIQNKDKILPEITVRFHPALFAWLVLLPTAAFALLAVLYAFFGLKKPVLTLLKESMTARFARPAKKEDTSEGRTFIADLRKSTLRSRKILVFFVVFSSFCFSAMTQMSFAMKDLSSLMMGAMIMVIGLILACTTLFLAVTAVIDGNTKTVAMMRAFGYSGKECRKALLDGYRPAAYIGFAVGTAYQYALLKIAVEIVFRDIEGIPEYKFDVPVMLVSLALFIAAYEIAMYYYSERIKRISVKEIMLE